MSVFWFIVIIGVSIFVHELGHYLAARLQGVGVPVFSIGFGPPLFSFRAAGTEWRVALIPLGGFALVEGMAPEPDEEPKGYARLPFWGKVLVLTAGVMMNLLLAWVLLAAVFTYQGIPEPVEDRAVVIEVVPGSLAERMGLRPGDVVVAVDGQPLERYTDLARVKERPGEHTFTVLRDGEEIVLKFVWDPEEKMIGVRYGPDVRVERPGPLGAFLYAVTFSLKVFPLMVKSFVTGILGVLLGRPSPELVGPVGIVAMTGEAARQGWAALAQLAATINLSLAVFNLLPIPGLDGGRLFLLVLGRVFGRITPEREALAHMIGLAFVLLLLVLITLQDLGRYLGGG